MALIIISSMRDVLLFSCMVYFNRCEALFVIALAGLC
jgi:hypothetical protein